MRYDTPENYQILRIASLFGFVILILLSACQPVPGQDIQQRLPEITLGYCPTMEPWVQGLVETHPTLVTRRYDTSASAMQALHAGQVQAILIGRVAWQNEVTESLCLVRLADGLTLIAKHPGMIRYEELSRIDILTLEEQAAIQNLLPAGTNVRVYSDFEHMWADFDETVAVLLRWSQVSPDENLLIPVDGAGNKIPGFRSPHFYYLESMEETLAPLLSTFSATQ